MVVEPWSRDETASFVIWTLNRSEITICLVNFPRWTSESRGTTTSVNHVLWHERKRLKRLNSIPLLNQWWNEVIKILIHASSTEKFQTSLHVSSLLQGMLLFHVSNPYLSDHHLRCVWDHNDSEPANPQSERGGESCRWWPLWTELTFSTEKTLSTPKLRVDGILTCSLTAIFSTTTARDFLSLGHIRWTPSSTQWRQNVCPQFAITGVY